MSLIKKKICVTCGKQEETCVFRPSYDKLRDCRECILRKNRERKYKNCGRPSNIKFNPGF